MNKTFNLLITFCLLFLYSTFSCATTITKPQEKLIKSYENILTEIKYYS